MLSLLTLLLVALPCIAVPASAGPAASCASGSTDPCCNLAAYEGGLDLMWLALTICQGTACPICGDSNAQNTASAAANQITVSNFNNLFAKNMCFGGQIAGSPGSGVYSLGSLHDWYFQYVLGSGCTIDCPTTANTTHVSKSVCSSGDPIISKGLPLYTLALCFIMFILSVGILV
jgi:hypothetical protein